MQTVRALVLVSACCFGLSSLAEEIPSATDLFHAIDDERVGVKFIAVDETHGNVLIENLTDQMLVIQLPDAIAAVPVLAQFGQGQGNGIGLGNGQGNGANGGGGGGGNQSVGGNLNAGQGQGQGQGFGMNGGQGAGQGMGLGMMRIPPKKQVKLVASTVCLEHGKAEPNPRIAYRMVRLSEYTNDQQIAQLCRQVGSSALSQNTAQAIAWHLANAMSWDQLAKLNSIESKYLGNVRYFRKRELDLAKQWIESVAAQQITDSVASTGGVDPATTKPSSFGQTR